MWKRMIVMLLAAGLVIGSLGYYKFSKFKQQMSMFALMGPPPPAVTTVVVKGQTWEPTLASVGSLKAVNGVQVSTDLAGIVSTVAFDSGKPVKKGDLLVKLDTQQEEAQLRSAQARYDLAKVNLARKQDLFDKKAAPQADVDSAAAEARQAQAAIDEVQAVIDRKTIRAPFDGLLGIRLVNLGQYLNAGTAVVPLESCDPIYVEFNLPQQNLGQIGLHKRVHVKAPDVSEKEFEGEITAIDSRVDEVTRNIQVEATVRNPHGVLRSGMFVKAEVLLPEQSGVLAIPASAINNAPYGDSVFVVQKGEPKNGQPQFIALQQFVKLGPSRGDLVMVTSGLKEGDEVITSGVFKLRSHEPVDPKAGKADIQPVRVNNEILPGNNQNPNPPDT